MRRKISIGYQEFEDIIKDDLFYIDKTSFIREWWEMHDRVTLITRPRRFGKTLTMSMIENFFSVMHTENAGLFSHLEIWKEKGYRELQGTYPVISITFANVKERTFQMTKQRIGQILIDLYNKHIFLLESSMLTEEEKRYFKSVTTDMDETVATLAIHKMSDFLSRYYGKKVIILLDEYDTPMQEAYVHGYWDELSSYLRSMFNASFKTNPYLERALMTGITRISKESIFSDLNNLEVVTTTSEKYADVFGFTEQEVISSLEEYGLADRLAEVKYWYDGFTFGDKKDIYNPWSIINYLDKQKVGTYWANTSSNSLIGKVIREGSCQIKESFEQLLAGKSITTQIDEQIIYNQLDLDENAIWSLLLASGYLKISGSSPDEHPYGQWRQGYELSVTNFEVMVMFRNMVHGWFSVSASNYNAFIKALLKDDLKAMNAYMNRVALSTFSFFDSGNKPSDASEPERFYHGFVLGLMVELEDQYAITSNRESGFGRYDVILEPRDQNGYAMIMEFKVQDPAEERNLTHTVQAALNQIEEKQYDRALLVKGIPQNRIRKYGFAFQGKTVLIGNNKNSKVMRKNRRG